MTKFSLRILPVFILLLSICSVPAVAQQDAPLPELRFKRLLNDLQVTVAPTPYLGEDLAIGLVVRYGAAFDLKGKEGVANLLSRMLLKATLEKGSQEIQSELAQLGAAIEVQCNWDGFRIILRGQSSQVDWALLLLYQVICEAQFNEADLLAARQSLLADLQKPPDPRQRIHSQFEHVLFNGTTYGRPIEGTQRSLSAITIGDIRYFYRRFFTPNQASLIIVGKVRASLVLQRASRIWGVWVRNEEIPFTFVGPRKPAGREIYVEDDPSSPAAQFILGNLFPRREDPAYTNAILATRIFQERLTKLLPTSLLTVGSEGRRLASPFYIQGQAAADQAVEQIRKIEGAAEDLKISAVSEEELDAARNEVIEEFNRQLRSADGLCHILLDAELYRLGSNYASVFADQIRRCDADAIKQAAKDCLIPDGEVLLIRGPARILRPQLAPLGRVQNLAP